MRIAQPEKNNMRIQEIPTSSPDMFVHDTNDDRQQLLRSNSKHYYQENRETEMDDYKIEEKTNWRAIFYSFIMFVEWVIFLAFVFMVIRLATSKLEYN